MRAYRLLLRFYPASFRNEYGEEMLAVFARRRRDVTSVFGVAALWIDTVVETLTNAAAVHWDILHSDLRYTRRTLVRSKGFTVTSMLVVGLGVGATTAAFSVTDFVLIRPLPFPNADRLVKLWQRTPGYSRMELSPAVYRDWKQGSRSYESLGAYHPLAANMIGKGEPMRLEGSSVSADLFPTLGVQPLIGRTFSEADDRDGAPGTLILSYRLWQTEFGGDPGVVGQGVVLDNLPYTIIGVMPREFRFPTSDAALWTTMRFGPGNYEDRNDDWLESVGRLRPGVTIEQARAELELLAAQMRQQFPKEHANSSAAIYRLRDEVSQQSRLLLVALSAASACVLLIACANLANLLLARALARRREIAVRTAMGAGRERLIRQLMTESLMLAFAGGALGVAVAVAAVPLLARLVPATLPIAETPSVDMRVLAFAAVLTALTGIAFGIAPVLRAGRTPDSEGLREGSRSGGGRKEGLRSALVIAEIGVSIVLLVSAGLLMRALWTIQGTDPGFRVDGVLTLRTPLPLPEYGAVSAREAFYARVLAEVRGLPGVTNAAYVSGLPMAMRGGIWPVSIDGQLTRREDNQVASLRYATPGFFATLRIPVKQGRDISESDAQGRQAVAIVSESFARRYWPGQDAIGRHFSFAFQERVVVGVVGDVRFRGLERTSEPQVYLPSKQVADNAIIGYIPKDLAIQSSTPPSALAPSVRAIIRRVDPKQPISDVRTLESIVDLETASRTAQLRVIGAFAVIAFVLAGIGIHGLLSFAVSQRAQEIGVRMALGAQSSDILNLVVKRSVWLAAAGVIPGIALAYGAGRWMQSLLAGVTPADGPTFLAAAVLSVVMTIAGTLVPTIRALRVNPITAIRTE